MWSKRTLRWSCSVAAAAALGILPALAFGQEAAPTPPPTLDDAMTKIGEGSLVANTVWVLIAAMLVFWMNAGFASLETGLCRRKNAVNILAKNFIVFGISAIAFWAAGYGMMFGGAADAEGKIASTKVVGMTGFFPSLVGDGDKFPGISWAVVADSVKFFFQLVFAGTAATIVSGAVAERVKFGMSDKSECQAKLM